MHLQHKVPGSGIQYIAWSEEVSIASLRDSFENPLPVTSYCSKHQEDNCLLMESLNACDTPKDGLKAAFKGLN